MARIEKEFFLSDDVVHLSRELIGCRIFTRFNGQETAAIITETEAYNGIHDKAAHSYGNKRTKRTSTMFGKGGVAYVYLCYGIHHLFNIVVGPQDVPKAILLRAIWPLKGVELMQERRGKLLAMEKMGAGPGTASQALGILTEHDGTDLQGNRIWLEDHVIRPQENDIIVGPRIGVDYAEEDAALPYRFRLTPSTIKQLLNGQST